MLVHVCDKHEDEVRLANPKTITIDGRTVEIDLCADHEKALLEAIGPFIESARVQGERTERPHPRPSSNGQASSNGSTAKITDKQLRRDIRKWANDNGYVVSPRGSIAEHVLAAYQAAH